MCYHHTSDRGDSGPVRGDDPEEGVRLLADGGSEDEGPESGEGDADAEDVAPDETEPEDAGTDSEEGPVGSDSGVDGSNVEITDEAEPAKPKWEEPDLDELPEFELGAEGPLTKGVGIDEPADAGGDGPSDPAAGRPNTARSPESTRISSEGTEAFVVAFEVCARLPDDVRLPAEAADLVPAAVEAELEEDVQQFAAAEFGTQTPHVDTLAFEDVDGEIWLRLRIGLPPEQFEDLDPEAVRSYALERLEGVL